MMTTNEICADCGEEGGDIGLKTCKACMLVRYCNADCQKNHWPTHKKLCKRRAAELRDEVLFKDPPTKEDCQICFLPMPRRLICCISLPPATILSVPIYDLAIANEELANKGIETYYTCCGKTICTGCVHSFYLSGNHDKCMFCNADQGGKSREDGIAEIMKRVEANDAGAICELAHQYCHGLRGFQQDHAKAMEIYARAAELGSSVAHFEFGQAYYDEGNLKKAKFHYEAAAMAGHEEARYNLANMEGNAGNVERAVKHWTIAASAGDYHAMQTLRKNFEGGFVSRESIVSTLAAYNSSCAEMRSEARDTYIRVMTAMDTS